MTAPLRLLKSLSRQSNFLKYHDRAILCTFGNYINHGNAVYHITQLDQRRNYAELAKNIVKSPFQDKEVPEVLLNNFIWDEIDKWSELTAVVSNAIQTPHSFRY